jgi:putative glutamine amidotransferase
MSRPRVLVVAHRREVDSVLGPQRASVVYEGYLERLERAGALPVVAWPGASWGEDVLDPVDGVLLVGGGDVDPARFGSSAAGDATDSARDDFEFALVQACRTRAVPLLAMCRGAQAMNVALGGSLREVTGHRQDGSLGEPSHQVSLGDDSRLAGMLGPAELAVNSFHRWAVDRPSPDLAVTATADDGTAEGVESTGEWWAVGVQWHAELIQNDRASSLFRGFVSAIEGGAP